MPPVRMSTAVAGVDFSWSPGEVVQLPAERAAQVVAAGWGELVRGEAAETPEGRTAELETAEGRKRPTRRRAPVKNDESADSRGKGD